MFEASSFKASDEREFRELDHSCRAESDAFGPNVRRPTSETTFLNAWGGRVPWA